MTVSRQEIDQMASFMRALSGGDAGEDSTPATPRSRLSESGYTADNQAPSRDAVPTVQRPVGRDTDEMKAILERFHAAADNTVAQSQGDRRLREALVTERTPRGSRIGEWEINARTEGRRTFYDVVAPDGSTAIASDLLLYEAAHGLVRILNGGGRINSAEAINLLRAEQQYAAALNEAVLYKHYLATKKRDARFPVFETRYGNACRKAVEARDRVYDLAERL